MIAVAVSSFKTEAVVMMMATTPSSTLETETGKFAVVVLVAGGGDSYSSSVSCSSSSSVPIAIAIPTFIFQTMEAVHLLDNSWWTSFLLLRFFLFPKIFLIRFVMCTTCIESYSLVVDLLGIIGGSCVSSFCIRSVFGA